MADVEHQIELAIWIGLIAISYTYNFYWTVTSLSFFSARVCYVLLAQAAIIGSRGVKITLALWLLRLILVILTIWCCLLTPIHIKVYSPMDFWTPYVEHAPLEAVTVLHDAPHIRRLE
jgi:hypothetical protein